MTFIHEEACHMMALHASACKMILPHNMFDPVASVGKNHGIFFSGVINPSSDVLWPAWLYEIDLSHKSIFSGLFLQHTEHSIGIQLTGCPCAVHLPWLSVHTIQNACAWVVGEGSRQRGCEGGACLQPDELKMRLWPIGWSMGWSTQLLQLYSIQLCPSVHWSIFLFPVLGTRRQWLRTVCISANFRPGACYFGWEEHDPQVAKQTPEQQVLLHCLQAFFHSLQLQPKTMVETCAVEILDSFAMSCNFSLACCWIRARVSWRFLWKWVHGGYSGTGSWGYQMSSLQDCVDCSGFEPGSIIGLLSSMVIDSGSFYQF